MTVQTIPIVGRDFIVVEVDTINGQKTKGDIGSEVEESMNSRRKIAIDLRGGNHYLRNYNGDYDLIRPIRRFEIALLEKLGYEVYPVEFKDRCEMFKSNSTEYFHVYATRLTGRILGRP